jgi:hypothetical protein
MQLTGIPGSAIQPPPFITPHPPHVAAMPKDTATIALNGDIGLPDFAKAIKHFDALLRALTSDVARRAKIKWEIASLDVGSAIASVRGVSEIDDYEAVSSVLTAYEDVGLSAQSGIESHHSARVNKAARKLFGLINGRVSSIRFETEDRDAEIVAPLESTSPKSDGSPQSGKRGAQPTDAVGAVQGRVQSLTSRGGLRFTLYDAIDDHAISCYLRDGMEPIMRDAWGQLCLVSGNLRRATNGKVATVRDVAQVKILREENRTAWRAAIGCAPAIAGSISAEEAIRRGRDG